MCLFRKYHWLRNLHLSKGGPRALRLSGFGVADLGLGRLYCSLGLPLLCWTWCYNPQIRRRLLLCDRNIWWFDGVSKEPYLMYYKLLPTVSFLMNTFLKCQTKKNSECCNNVLLDKTRKVILRYSFYINKKKSYFQI